MNISEFAVYAGVSKSAVSRYFNDGYLSDDKRELIEKAIAETGYSPGISARTSKNRVTKLVGVIIPKLSSESISRVVEGISEALSAEGYELLLVNTFNDCRKEISSLELFRNNRVDGVILLGTVFTDLHLSVLGKMHVPVVIAGQNVKGFNCVCHNDEGAAYALTKLMLEKGRKKPAMIGVTKDDDGNLVYNPRSFVRNSRNFGVPQNRPRVYIMGFSRKHFGDAVDDLPNELPTERKEKIYKDLNDLLEMNADDKYFLSSGYVETLERHKARHESKGNGFGYKIVNLPEIESPVSNAILATGGSGKERNLVIDPKKGVAGKVLKSKQTPLNDKGIRAMTPREWGKLQGFINYAFVDETGHDSFSFPEDVPNVQKYKQFGNSVTIPVIKQMATFILDCIDQLTAE